MPDVSKAVTVNPKLTAAVRAKAVKEIIERLDLVTSSDLAVIFDRAFTHGIPAFDSLKIPKYQERIQLFIKEFNIRPLAEAAIVSDRRWIAGGRFADLQHLHHDNKTYLLNDEQFAALNKALANDLKYNLQDAFKVEANLKKASAVKF